MVASGNSCSTASTHLLGGFNRRDFGAARGRQGQWVRLTSNTRAPRRNAASASAYPMRPLERLVR